MQSQVRFFKFKSIFFSGIHLLCRLCSGTATDYHHFMELWDDRSPVRALFISAPFDSLLLPTFSKSLPAEDIFTTNYPFLLPTLKTFRLSPQKVNAVSRGHRRSSLKTTNKELDGFRKIKLWRSVLNLNADSLSKDSAEYSVTVLEDAAYIIGPTSKKELLGRPSW